MSKHFVLTISTISFVSIILSSLQYLGAFGDSYVDASRILDKLISPIFLFFMILFSCSYYKVIKGDTTYYFYVLIIFGLYAAFLVSQTAYLFLL